MADPHARKEGAHAPPPSATPSLGAIIASPGEGAAAASRPDQLLDGGYNSYESNPAPWWIGLLWVSFLIFGAAYLIFNLLA